MEIKEICKELEKWAEEDKENRSVFAIATEDMGEQVSSNAMLIGKAINLINAYLNNPSESIRCFQKLVMRSRLSQMVESLIEMDDNEEQE